jgi:ribosomal 50S subunit-recycling heat shock protein
LSRLLICLLDVTNLGKVRTVLRLVRCTLAFALQLRKKHGKTVSQGSWMKTEYTEQNITIRIHNLQNLKQKYTKHTIIYTHKKRKNTINTTTPHHLATLHHTSPNYTSLIDTSIPPICSSLVSHLA